MTPKEKAFKLIHSFFMLLPNNGLEDGINNINDRWEEAKKCALLTIDYMLNWHYYNVPYWQEVKQEIEKL